MKSLILILIYLGTFMFLFFVMSLIGLLWFSYYDCITSANWFIIYLLFFGSWMSSFPAVEYYELNKAYFERIYN